MSKIKFYKVKYCNGKKKKKKNGSFDFSLFYKKI